MTNEQLDEQDKGMSTYQIVIRDKTGDMILPAYREWPVVATQAWQLAELLKGRAIVGLVYDDKTIVLDGSGIPTYEVFMNQFVSDIARPVEEDIPF